MDYTLELLGEGSFNKAYKIYKNGTLLGVLKLPKLNYDPHPSFSQDENKYITIMKPLDTIERSIRIWNEINPDLPAKKFSLFIEGTHHTGWLTPFIEGKEATDIQKAELLTKIYKETGRIIIDGVAKNNILTNANKKAVCIDIGLAVLLDNNKSPQTKNKSASRRTSITGIAPFQKLQPYYQNEFFPNHALRGFPHSVKVIKSLIFINSHLPEERNVSFLNKYPQDTEAIADAYDKELLDPDKSMDAVKNTLIRIKCLCFINRNLNGLKDIDILKSYPDIEKIIAEAYDIQSTDPNSVSKSVNLIKSLIFIDKHLNGLKDASFLKSHPETAKIIADAYDNMKLSRTHSIDKSLSQIKSLIFINKHLPSLVDVSFLKRFHGTTELIASAYEKELSRSNDSLNFVEETIQRIKALNFINRNLKDLKNVDFLKSYPDIEKIIAEADDNELSHPNTSKDSVNKAINLIKSLNFIKENLPNIGTVAFLKNQDDAAKVLAKAYGSKKEELRAHAINLIKSLILINNYPSRFKDVSFLNDYPEATKIIANASDKTHAIKLIKCLSFMKSHGYNLKNSSSFNFSIPNVEKIASAYEKESINRERNIIFIQSAIDLFNPSMKGTKPSSIAQTTTQASTLKMEVKKLSRNTSRISIPGQGDLKSR